MDRDRTNQLPTDDFVKFVEIFYTLTAIEMENTENKELIKIQVQQYTERIEAKLSVEETSKLFYSRGMAYSKLGQNKEAFTDVFRSYDLVANEDAMRTIVDMFTKEVQESKFWIDDCRGVIWKDSVSHSQKESEIVRLVKEFFKRTVEKLVFKRYKSVHRRFEREETPEEVLESLEELSMFKLHPINNDQLIWGVLNEDQLISGYGIEFRTRKKALSRKRIFNVFFVGRFSDELREGEGREYDLSTNSLLIHAQYSDSLLEGKGREFNKAGVVIYEGQYKKNLRHGRGDFYDEKRKVMIRGIWDKSNLVRDISTLRIEPFKADFHRIEMHLDHEKLVGRGVNGDDVYKLSSSLFPELKLPSDQKFVAVKIFNTHGMGEEEKNQLSLELDNLFQLILKLKKNSNEKKSDFIVDYYGIVCGKEIGYITEYLDYSIESLIEKKVNFGIDEIMRILRGTAICLDFIHSQHIIHKDLNWSNVYLSYNGKVKIGGFDESIEDIRHWNWKAENNTSENTIAGDLIFTAPEIFLGVRSIGVECDVYSFGLMMYSLLMRCKNPFSTTTKCTKCGGKIEMQGLQPKEQQQQQQPKQQNGKIMILSSSRPQRTRKNAPPPLLLLAKHLKGCGLEPSTDETVIDEKLKKKYMKYGELDFLIGLMRRCWDSKHPEKRPSMSSIVSSFNAERTKKECYSFIHLDMKFVMDSGVLEEKQGGTLLRQPTIRSLKEKVMESSGRNNKIMEMRRKDSGERLVTDNDVVKMLMGGPGGQGSSKVSVGISVMFSSEKVDEIIGIEDHEDRMNSLELMGRISVLESENEEQMKLIDIQKKKIEMLGKEVMSLQEKLLEESF